MTQIIKPLRSGQITIPASFRQSLGIDSSTLLQISEEKGELHIKPVKVAQVKPTAWLENLYEHFESVRKETKKYTEEEVNKSIDKATKSVRSSHG